MAEKGFPSPVPPSFRKGRSGGRIYHIADSRRHPHPPPCDTPTFIGKQALRPANYAVVIPCPKALAGGLGGPTRKGPSGAVARSPLKTPHWGVFRALRTQDLLPTFRSRKVGPCRITQQAIRKPWEARGNSGGRQPFSWPKRAFLPPYPYLSEKATLGQVVIFHGACSSCLTAFAAALLSRQQAKQRSAMIRSKAPIEIPSTGGPVKLCRARPCNPPPMGL